jgi:hypothetical protein
MAEIVYDGGSPSSTFSSNPGPLLGLTYDCTLLVAVGDLVLGAVDEYGNKWTVPTFEGWDGSPSPTLQLTQRAGAHGATASESFLTPRYLKVGGFIHATDHVALNRAIDRLNAVVTLTPFRLTVAHDEGTRHCQAQRNGEVITNRVTDKLASYSLLLVVKDPRKLGDSVSYTTRLPYSEGGVIYPVTYPLTYTGTSGSGVVTINNPGNTQAPVWLRIAGPLPAGGWTITHQGKRQTLSFAASLELTNGEFVTVDMDRKEILAQGQAARSGYITRRGWFSLDPGDNDIAFSAVNYSAEALLTITTKPAWS